MTAPDVIQPFLLPAAADRPRSRRAMMAGLVGGAGAWIAAAVGHTGPTRAAAGDPLLLGHTNYAGAAVTKLNTSSTSGGFGVTQNGTGFGVRGESLHGNGGAFVTHATNKNGLVAQNVATSTSGGAGLYATHAAPNGLAILAQNVSAGVGSNAGSGIRALSGGGTLSDIHPVDPDILTPDWDAAGEFAGPCGVIGVATSTGIGVIGRGVRGVFGYGTSSGVFGKSFGGIGVDGISTEGTGVSGGSEIGIGVGGASQHGYGVYGSSNQDGYAVYAEAQSGIGVSASSISSYGVTGSSGTGVGVAGGSDSSDGLRGASNSGYGVHGISSTNYAGYFEGSLYAQTYIDLPESVVPPAPSANGARLFVRDNGSGKTQLCVLFPTGAVQVVATEP